MALGGCAAPQAVFLGDRFQLYPLSHKGEGEEEFNLFSAPINTWCETYLLFWQCQEAKSDTCRGTFAKMRINPGQRTQANERGEPSTSAWTSFPVEVFIFGLLPSVHKVPTLSISDEGVRKHGANIPPWTQPYRAPFPEVSLEPLAYFPVCIARAPLQVSNPATLEPAPCLRAKPQAVVFLIHLAWFAGISPHSER